jgi:hypothetical protein
MVSQTVKIGGLVLGLALLGAVAGKKINSLIINPWNISRSWTKADTIEVRDAYDFERLAELYRPKEMNQEVYSGLEGCRKLNLPVDFPVGDKYGGKWEFWYNPNLDN